MFTQLSVSTSDNLDCDIVGLLAKTSWRNKRDNIVSQHNNKE